MSAQQLHEAVRRNSSIRAALEHLLEARRTAELLKLDVWIMAVEMCSLLHSGSCTTTHLRLLVGTGYVEHAEDATKPSDEIRTFQPESPMKFGPQSCFVLTKAGVKFLEGADSSSEQGDNKHNVHPHPNEAAEERRTPVWDADARELWVGKSLVKRFRRPAPILELVLAGFEELGWPHHLDDPLPPEHEIVPEERLRDTVRRLNRCQNSHQIRFESDGLGAGIRWSWVDHGVEEPTDKPRLTHVDSFAGSFRKRGP